jgi:hypothetical protein
MAAKRRREDSVDSSAEFAKPVYLVAKRCAPTPAYSVLMVDAAAAVAGGRETPPARYVGEFAGGRSGMSFVAAHSKHGSWIVGVGGQEGQFVTYDPSTKEEFTGPSLRMLKHEPILISHGGMLYAMSRRPKVHIKAECDFQPWFECINFNKGVPRILHGDICCWRALPSPPFFPCFLNPEEFRNPPDISVSSYAAVGPYILVSLEQQDKGTYAFHVVKKTWEKVCDRGLPFVGQAVPLGGSLFAACVVSDNAAATSSVFHMSIKTYTTEVSPELVTRVVSVQDFTVASKGEIPRPLFCPLGKGSFCSIRMAGRQRQESSKFCSLRKGSLRSIRKAARRCQESNNLMDHKIILTGFQMENIEVTLMGDDLKAPVHLEQHNRTYEFNAQHLCPHLPMPVVAALSM